VFGKEDPVMAKAEQKLCKKKSEKQSQLR